MGYLHPQFEGLLKVTGIEVDARGNVADKNYQTNIPKVFSAGDMQRSEPGGLGVTEGRGGCKGSREYLAG